MVPLSRQFQTFTFILSYAYWVPIYNDPATYYPHKFKYMLFTGIKLYEKHYPLKVFKFFCATCRIQNVIDFTIITIGKNTNWLVDIAQLCFFHNGPIQQPERLNLGSLHPAAAPASPFFHCSYLTCLTLYSGRAQKHLSAPSAQLFPTSSVEKGAHQT